MLGFQSNIQTLLSYYLTVSKVIEDEIEISKYKYVITYYSKTLEKLYVNKVFKILKNLTIIAYF